MECYIGSYSGLPVVMVSPPGKEMSSWRAEAIMPGCHAFICRGADVELVKMQAERFVFEWMNYPRFQTHNEVEAAKPAESMVG